ncbi:hypothetical protein GCM10010168_53780 [Actinoplanes ianthinogenes]|uniref:Uncharacterized protein n=1 Tax=Actinoplanes ianthinogenes TaxID=122358 RepID=A0ABM7LQU2_9ACTN|nr:hypothetical protein [Actinoplanes ianthinogenes]BCJ41624.1 hypothetical protein Aiant_22810 [Actinoplanes ianthinogenes]GGR28833.1 hypothetical protein GCM10010168_53780 [Actinoplanes ianthinogenes]
MGSLGRGVRGLASVMVAVGVIGSVGSGIVLLVTLLVAKDRADLAGHAFVFSGQVLCVGAVLFGAARLLEGRRVAHGDPETEESEPAESLVLLTGPDRQPEPDAARSPRGPLG